jgi:hypothetical protein
VHRLFINLKKAYGSTRKAPFYNVLVGFGTPMKLVRLIKMCLSETYTRVRVDKHLSAMIPVNICWNLGDAL